MRKVLAVLLVSFVCCSLLGDEFEDVADELVGYTILSVKTVDGDFEGCDFDKKIIFTDGTYVTCMGYGYQYSYMPKAILLGTNFKGHTLFKIYVGGKVYNVI